MLFIPKWITTQSVATLLVSNHIFLSFSAYGLFLKAKEYGEKVIQDVVASWWMIIV